MSVRTDNTASPAASLPKVRTGIAGFDEITYGGLPEGRPTLVCGAAGCGKTLFALEFLVRGAIEFDEPGVFVAFEETAAELTQNVRSLGFDLDALTADQRLVVDHVFVDRHEIEETGEYDLEGLFLRLGYAIDSVGAKRVVLDTLEAIFGALSNEALLRSELRRLFRWLKARGVTAVITAERGDGSLTRHGLEEYVSDCVILLDHRVSEQVSTRRLRVVKYRGTTHGTNEYPFLINEDGITVLPITSMGLQHAASEERVSTGIPRLDGMLGGGIFRGSSVLVSGTAGTGKTSLASHMALAACRRGEQVLYFAFEESRSQIARNMRSIGLDLEPWIEKGCLVFHASRPTALGLETHLATMQKLIGDVDPRLVVIDPISNLETAGSLDDASALLIRLVDFLKERGTTAVFTNLNSASGAESTDVGISSLIDTWLLLRSIEVGGERNRGLFVLKSRGTDHSNQIREFRLTSRGVELADVYVGPAGVLTGSARLAQEARERSEAARREQDLERRRREMARRREALAAQIRALQMQQEAEEDELNRLLAEAEETRNQGRRDRQAMARQRHADRMSEEEPS
ncbi:MAG TPA: circadian clock protein KaiC [Methylomirabilota bacterium]